jgi:CelD/BcsL family acetyltransferase involved in cellulose biosynthesis
LGKAESIVIEDLVVGSPLWEALTTPKLPGVDVFHPHEPQPHWWIEFPQQPLQYWDKFSTRLRGKFRQRATRLGAVRCFRSVDQVPPFLAMAHEICANRRQARGSDMPVANSPRELAFWKLAAHHGGMRSYVLEHENRPVAFALAEQWNQRLVYRQIGYDQAYADYHPGQALLYRVLQDVIERDCPKVVDLGVGDVDDKGVFANQQVLTGPIVLVRSSWRPRAAMQMDLLRRKTSNALRAGLRHLGRLTRVRRLHRTKP